MAKNILLKMARTLAMYSCLIHVLVWITNVQAVSYSDLENLGAICEGRDSCLNLMDPGNFSKRNCECDRFCTAYGDCCIDGGTTQTVGRYRNERFSCVQFGKDPYQGAYVIDSCPRNYVGPASVRNRCEGRDAITDPLMSVPVTAQSSDVTYRNVYCAECNGVTSESNLIPWLILLNCETLAPYNLNQSFIWRGLEFISGDWGVQFRGDFHACDVLYDKPASVSKGLRLCRANAISTCLSDWTRVVVKENCESYTAVMYTRDKAYKNVHCAICNGEELKNLKCSLDSFLFRKWKPFSFALLLDVNRSCGDLVGVCQACATGQKYDPFFKKCRNLVCGPGYSMVDGKCTQK